jgi:oligopeptide/dipeptide ABC transporter ATP-binding protein
VGESGCGKTTLSKVILGLEKPTSGSIIFEGSDIFELGRRELRRLRREMQVIFQDPYDSLDPRMTVGEIIDEPLVVHGIGDRLARQKRRVELLEMVGLSSASAKRYPHEFSGGQRQRIAIARALALNPKFIVCDEPVSALDVSIQSQILNLLWNLKREFNLTYLFIAHGLAVVKHISERVAVMYLGKIVELANKHEIYSNPQHPYTEALISMTPIPDPMVRRKRLLMKGDVPSPIRPPSGCHFHPRCLHAQDICTKEEPPLINIGTNHWVGCHLRFPKKK